MEPSELPPFPTPEPPPPTPAASPTGRGTSMFLQALFLLAFWPAVYFTHEHTAALLAAEQKVREQEQREQEQKAAIERITGRWISTRGDGAILSFVENRFLVIRFLGPDQYYRTLPLGGVQVSGQSYLLATSYAGDIPARIVGDELEVEFGEIGQQYFARRGLPWDGVWRFKRLK